MVLGSTVYHVGVVDWDYTPCVLLLAVANASADGIETDQREMVDVGTPRDVPGEGAQMESVGVLACDEMT